MLGGKAHYDYHYYYNLHFATYIIFDQQLKITFRKPLSPPPPEKIQFPLKVQKVQEPPFLRTLKIFQVTLKKGG